MYPQVPHARHVFECHGLEGMTLRDVADHGEGAGAATLGEYLECACSGVMACSTCHVIVDAAWSQLVGAPDQSEQVSRTHPPLVLAAGVRVVFIYIYTHIWIYIYIYIFIYAYVNTHIYTYVNTYMHTHTHVCIYIHINMYILIHIYTYLYISIYIYIHIYV